MGLLFRGSLLLAVLEVFNVQLFLDAVQHVVKSHIQIGPPDNQPDSRITIALICNLYRSFNVT